MTTKDLGGFIIPDADKLVDRLRDMKSKRYSQTWAGWVQAQTGAAADRIEELEIKLAASEKESKSNDHLFISACEDLGAISEALNIDSNIDGGAEPILEAISRLIDVAIFAASVIKSNGMYELSERLAYQRLEEAVTAAGHKIDTPATQAMNGTGS